MSSSEKKTFGAMSMSERWAYVREVVTIEPIVLCYFSSTLICGPAVTELALEKSCRADCRYNDTVCDVINTEDRVKYPEENERVQALVNNMFIWSVDVALFVPMILVLFLGAFSDRRQLRKPFLLLPIFGEFFTVGGYILAVVYMKELPLAVLGITMGVIPAFFGGLNLFLMATYAYIADVSTIEMRTLRFGIVQILLNVANVSMSFLGGRLLKNFGSMSVFVVAGLLLLFAFLYGLFYVRESRQPVKSKKCVLVDAFDPSQLLETFGLLLKRKPGNNRVYIVIVLFILLVINAARYGEQAIEYFFFKDRFNMDVTDHSIYTSGYGLTHLVGITLGVALFTRVLKLSDYTIVLISFADKILANFAMFFAPKLYVIYIAAVISMISGIANIGIRSLSTKVVSVEDFGKVQSIFGIGDTAGEMLGNTMYNQLYQPKYPSMYLLLSNVLYTMAGLLTLWKFCMQKNKERRTCVITTNDMQMQTTQTVVS